jgi:hypothetical protein
VQPSEHAAVQLSAAAKAHITATLRVMETSLSHHSTATAAAAVSTDHSSNTSSSHSTALQDSIAAAHAMAVAMSAQLREGSSSAVCAFHTSNGSGGMMAVASHISTLPRGAVLALLQQLQSSGHPLAALDLAVAAVAAAADCMQQRADDHCNSSSAHSSSSVMITSSSRREIVQWLSEGLRGWSSTAGTSRSLQQDSSSNSTNSSSSSSSSGSSSGSVCDSAVKLRLHLLQLVVHGAPGLAAVAIEAAVTIGDAPYVQALQLAAESAAEDTAKARMHATSGMLLQCCLEKLQMYYIEHVLCECLLA